MFPRMPMRSVLALALLLLGVAASQPARAHPHVWVVARAEIVYGQDGRIAGVRHAWTFDEAYSAFAVQGLDKNNDGKLTSEELQELANVNVESLHEFDFFTFARSSGARQEFGRPTSPRLAYDKAQLTLTFMLPLKTPANRRTFSMEIYDQTWFVDFRLADGDDAVRLVDAPSGCARTLTRPKPPEQAPQQTLSEDFFSSMAGQSFGANFINRVLVACP